MDASVQDYADARNNMVDSQIRPNKVNDPRIIAAMRELPREQFVPAQMRDMAYIDSDVSIGHGRFLMEPMVIARLVQLLAPIEGEQALVIGCGSGYGAALLAACGARVTALEEDRALLDMARATLTRLAPSVSVVSGPLADGWPNGAPYDLILIEGAVQQIPAVLNAQVRVDTGRLATVLKPASGMGHAVLAEPTPVGLRAQPAFDCGTPLIPSLQPRPGFVF